jgi:DNA modification methylase
MKVIYMLPLRDSAALDRIHEMRQEEIEKQSCSKHVLIGDCRDALESIPSQSVHLAMTSPPYNLVINYGE